MSRKEQARPAAQQPVAEANAAGAASRSRKRPLLNGFAPARLEALNRLRTDKAQAADAFGRQWRSRVRWLGGFRASATHGDQSVQYDELLESRSTGTSISAHEHLLSALGGCLVAGFVLHATRLGIELDEVEVSLEGTFDNFLKWIGADDSGNPGYRWLSVTLHVRSSADPETLREIWERSVEHSPVAQTIARPTPILTSIDTGAPRG